MSLLPPEIPSIVVDEAFQRKLFDSAPSLNEPDLVNQWFILLPNPQRDKASDEADARLYCCGIILTELRKRAIGQRSVERLHRVHVFADEMQQIAQHLAYRDAQTRPGVAAKRLGIELPPGFGR